MSFIDGFDLAITAFKYRNALEHVERFLSRFTQNTDFSFLALFSFLSCFRIFTQNFSVQNFKNFGRCQINKIEKWRHTNVEASTRIKIIRKWFGIASIEMDMRLYAGDTYTVFPPRPRWLIPKIESLLHCLIDEIFPESQLIFPRNSRNSNTLNRYLITGFNTPWN